MDQLEKNRANIKQWILYSIKLHQIVGSIANLQCYIGLQNNLGMVFILVGSITNKFSSRSNKLSITFPFLFTSWFKS